MNSEIILMFLFIFLSEAYIVLDAPFDCIAHSYVREMIYNHTIGCY